MIRYCYCVFITLSINEYGLLIESFVAMKIKLIRTELTILSEDLLHIINKSWTNHRKYRPSITLAQIVVPIHDLVKELISFVLWHHIDVEELRVEKRENLFLFVKFDWFEIILIPVLRLIMSHFV